MLRSLDQVLRARNMIQFNVKTLERLHEISCEIGVDDTELTLVTKVRAFKDPDTWNRVKSGVRALEEDHQALKGMYRLVYAATCGQVDPLNEQPPCHKCETK